MASCSTGRSHADESVLTGESAPRPKAPGDPVICGSINTGNVLEIRATLVGADSTLAQIVRKVEQAALSRTRIEHAVDRASRVFIPAVLLLSVLTFAGWQWRTGNPAEALMHAIAVLVIACPCALGIATPLALTAAVAAASRRGILVSDTRVLETIRQVDVVVLDKTGTVTTGDFTLLETAGDTTRMAELAAIESCSEHPIARAIAGGESLSLPATNVRTHKGQGITRRHCRHRIFSGKPTPRREHDRPPGRPPRDSPPNPGPSFTTAGTPPSAAPWPSATASAPRLRRFAPPCASAASAPCSSPATPAPSPNPRPARSAPTTGSAKPRPEQKVETIRNLQQSGKCVAMAGDGVNDAPSLAQADLGIAIGGGADLAIQAAPLVLMNGSLGAVIETLDLARRTFRIVRQNLFWAFAYNAAGITLAMTGILSPIMAAGAMVLSSLSVIGNSRRL